MENEEILRQAYMAYGHQFQFDLLLEECAELQKAIIKNRRGGDISDVVEELADVQIMIDQARVILRDWDKNTSSPMGKDEYFDRCYKSKMERLEKRLKWNHLIQD